MDLTKICSALGYSGEEESLDISVTPKGFRIMSMIPRLPMAVMRNLLERFSNLQGILKATIEELDTVEGIGEVRARSIKEGLRRVHNQFLLDSRHF
jgi:diadenylate cyclase